MVRLFDIKDKIVLITGSTRGLGFVFAKGFASAGAKVILNGVNRNRLENRIAELKDSGYDVHGYNLNVNDTEQVSEVVESIESEIGSIDCLINNAGIHKRMPLEEMTLEAWKEVVDTNLTAVFNISQCVANRMKKRNQGKIINITSLNAIGARATISNYCAAKGGLTMFTKSLATEYGKYNIQSNAIAPGYFLTDLTKPLSENPEFDQWVKQEVPLERWGDPEELLGAAIFLASKASSYVNGQTIVVDGGWLACL